jgi:hypothetical protein
VAFFEDNAVFTYTEVPEIEKIKLVSAVPSDFKIV